MHSRATTERRVRTRERLRRPSMPLVLTEDCIVCGASGEVRRRGVVLCRDCELAAHPHHDGDRYDDLGGGD